MLEIGSLVDGKYKILSEIGHGGMSVVYMAINEKANKTWAVKEVRKDGKMDFNTVRQGLMAEIETLKNLDHPNLPSIIDVIEDDDSFIIVMDYIEGRSLDKIIAENGAQPEEYVVEWAKQICDVFGYLHSRTPPIIYRDMKPANIMLRPDGNIMVIDFGTAKKYEIDLGQTTGMGTIGYAAPEQYINSGFGRTDKRTDIYCLGMTMYHLLTDIDPCKQLIEKKSVREINPALSHGIDTIVQKCIQYNPDDRYQNCAELMYDLENYEILEPLYKKKQKKKFHGFVFTIIFSLICLLVGIGLNLGASMKATDIYETKIFEASKEIDFDKKAEIYQECIDVPGKAGEKDAYLGLIQAFKENDSVFTVEEAGVIQKLIKKNKDELQKNKENYVEICFETGKLFWYYYNYGGDSDNQITRAQSSAEWFGEVLNNADDDYKNLGMAIVYSEIGKFYRDITTDITEANDKGKYQPLFENLKVLNDNISADENENEIVKLELYEITRSAIQSYATKFKTDGVTEDELRGLYLDLCENIDAADATVDKTKAKKNKTVSLLPATGEAIEVAYSTDKEAEE